jgi:hypothetical protein
MQGGEMSTFKARIRLPLGYLIGEFDDPDGKLIVCRSLSISKPADNVKIYTDDRPIEVTGGFMIVMDYLATLNGYRIYSIRETITPQQELEIVAWLKQFNWKYITK